MEKELTPNQRLKAYRESLNLSQKEFAKRLGYNQSYYSEIERGVKAVTSKITNKLFALFKVSSDWLLNGIGDTPIGVMSENVVGNDVGTSKIDDPNPFTKYFENEHVIDNDPVFFEWLHKNYANQGLTKYFRDKKEEVKFYYHATIDLMEVIDKVHKIPFSTYDFETNGELFPEKEGIMFRDSNLIEYHESLSTKQKIEYLEQLDKRLLYVKEKFKRLLRFLFMRTLYPDSVKNEDINKDRI